MLKKSASGVLSSHASMRLQSMPFDCKRMAWGGFQTLVDLQTH